MSCACGISADMTAWREFKSLLRLLALVVLCAGLLAAAKGKRLDRYRGKPPNPRRPGLRTQVSVLGMAGYGAAGTAGGSPSPTLGERDAWDELPSLSSQPSSAPATPPPFLPLTWAQRRCFSFLGGEHCQGERSQARVGLKQRCGSSEMWAWWVGCWDFLPGRGHLGERPGQSRRPC